MNNRFSAAERRGTMILVVITFMLMLWLVIYKSCHGVSTESLPYVGDSVAAMVRNPQDTIITVSTDKSQARKANNKRKDKNKKKRSDAKSPYMQSVATPRSHLDETVN